MDQPNSKSPPRPLWEQVLRAAAFVGGIATMIYIAIAFLFSWNGAEPVHVGVHVYEVQEGDWLMFAVLAAAFAGLVWLYARTRKR